MVVLRDPIADLRRRLGRQSKPQAKVRAIIRAWWADHGFDEHPAAVGKRIALALLERRTHEDKLAGILVLHELLGDQLRVADLSSFARLFAANHIADAAVADAFGRRVLGALLARDAGRTETLRALAGWRAAETVWQRRAACLALATVAPHGDQIPNLTETILVLCAAFVWSADPADQAAVGVVLRELARGEPICVEAFIRRYARFMSKACARQAIAKLPASSRAELLAHHRRATTIRRG